MRQPYIKPTRYKHSSGYRTFEVGYILEMSEDNRVLKKEVITQHSDHIHQDYLASLEGRGFAINMDLTMDGYIRLYLMDKKGRMLKWQDFPLSSMELECVVAPQEPTV